MIQSDEFRARFDKAARNQRAIGFYTAAIGVACFKDHRFDAEPAQRPCRGNSGESAADDSHPIRKKRAALRGSCCESHRIDELCLFRLSSRNAFFAGQLRPEPSMQLDE